MAVYFASIHLPNRLIYEPRQDLRQSRIRFDWSLKIVSATSALFLFYCHGVKIDCIRKMCNFQRVFASRHHQFIHISVWRGILAWKRLGRKNLFWAQRESSSENRKKHQTHSVNLKVAFDKKRQIIKVHRNIYHRINGQTMVINLIDNPMATHIN